MNQPYFTRTRRAVEHIDLAIEALEHRRMMAGDVEVTVTGGGDLNMSGDGENNAVLVEALNASGSAVRVIGIEGTTINGQASATFTGVSDDLRINLRGGDNRLILTAGDQEEFVVQDELRIDTQGGSDAVVLDGLQVGGNMTVRTRGGSDAVYFAAGTVQGRTHINTAAGDDVVMVDDAFIDYSFFHARMQVSTGAGDDAVSMRGAVTGRMDVRLGGGNDEFEASHSDFGDGRISGNGGDDQYGLGVAMVNGPERVTSIIAGLDGDALQNVIDYQQESDAFDRAYDLMSSFGR